MSCRDVPTVRALLQVKASPALQVGIIESSNDMQMRWIALHPIRGDPYDELMSRIADEPHDLLVIRPRQMRPTRNRRILQVRAVSTLGTRGERESRTEEEHRFMHRSMDLTLGVSISVPAKSRPTRIELYPREFVFCPYRGHRRKSPRIIERRYCHVNPFRIDFVLDKQRRATTSGERA